MQGRGVLRGGWRRCVRVAGLLSPRATSSIDMTAAAALGLLPGSPRHFAPPPGSPSAMNNGGAASAHWLQGSRLRSSFNARDATVEDLGLLLDWESQYLGALCLPPSSRPQPRLSTGLTNRMYSPRALDLAALVQSPIGGMSPRSPRLMEPTSPINARFGATVTQREMYEQFSNLNKHQLPSVGSPRNSNAASWGNAGSPIEFDVHCC
ncbi:Zinc finger CCCH domain-containing protein 50 [Hordeum vulgare]|nr:Zinc finger CCCH domain-containing protein 50 [Hordeum vulgare]